MILKIGEGDRERELEVTFEYEHLDESGKDPDRMITKCCLFVSGEAVKSVAVCNPIDAFKKSRGRAISLKRAIKKWNEQYDWGSVAGKEFTPEEIGQVFDQFHAHYAELRQRDEERRQWMISTVLLSIHSANDDMSLEDARHLLIACGVKGVKGVLIGVMPKEEETK